VASGTPVAVIVRPARTPKGNGGEEASSARPEVGRSPAASSPGSKASLQPDLKEGDMHQEVDLRNAVTSLAGDTQHLYEEVYCKLGQMENLIKLHKTQLASDRTSCHSATANQVRLVLHTAAFWLNAEWRFSFVSTIRCSPTDLLRRLRDAKTLNSF
jgi:hypothetical protein